MEVRTINDRRSNAATALRRHEDNCMRETKVVNRRAFLGFGAVAAAAAVVPSKAAAASTGAVKAPERVLWVFNTHTGDRLNPPYCTGGSSHPDALRDLNFILRDSRANEIKPIDPRVFDLLHELGGT